MSSQPHHRSRWHKFKKKYSGKIYIGIGILIVLVLVALLMYLLTSPEWRTRPRNFF